ncbi:MAG: hypothetical protein GY711_04570 [bacterium]|nr:hypothetical protein [bacterium]
MRILILLLCMSSAAAQTSVVVPALNAQFPGGGGNLIPSSQSVADNVSRYQQVYSATDLSAVDGHLLGEVAFRLRSGDDSIAGGFAYDQLIIRMSTTLRDADSLSTDLDTVSLCRWQPPPRHRDHSRTELSEFVVVQPGRRVRLERRDEPRLRIERNRLHRYGGTRHPDGTSSAGSATSARTTSPMPSR